MNTVTASAMQLWLCSYIESPLLCKHFENERIQINEMFGQLKH